MFNNFKKIIKTYASEPFETNTKHFNLFIFSKDFKLIFIEFFCEPKIRLCNMCYQNLAKNLKKMQLWKIHFKYQWHYLNTN